MEEGQNLPSPSLVFIHGAEDDDDAQFMTFCPINEEGEDVPKNLTQRVYDEDTSFKLGCDNWLIVLNQDEISECGYSLWNAVTMEDPIYFPQFKLKPGNQITHHILMAPPGNPDCMLILFEKTTEDAPSLSYCREGDEDWTSHIISDDRLKPDSDIRYPIAYNGKIYCCCSGSDGKKLLAVLDIKPDGLAFSFSVLLGPRALIGSWKPQIYIIESCGELFLIYLDCYEKTEEQEVCAVEVFKLDVQGERAEWQKVESFEDIAFFVGPVSKFSCPAGGSVKGNHIYFTLPDDGVLYAFNMESQTIISSMPRLCASMSPWSISFWLKPVLRSSDLVQNERQVGKCIEFENQEVVKHSVTVEGHFSKLPLELFVEIGKHLQLHDYMNFRSLNTKFKKAAPLPRKDRVLEGNIPSPPLLMSGQMNNKVWTLIDPLHKERYFLTQNNDLEDAMIYYSKREWCLVISMRKDFVLLWNPFSKKTIPLPNLPPLYTIISCSFSSLLDSPESDCTIVLGVNYYDEYCIASIKLGDKKWKRRFFDCASNFSKLTTDNSLLLYKGSFYFLDDKGNLGIYKEDDGGEDDDGDEDEVVPKFLNHVTKCPCESFYQSALLECENKLLSIFLGSGGENVLVFQLDESHMTWSKVEDIGNHTIYLSRFSSFSTVAFSGMQNKIYFSRYCGDRGVVYYSLESEMLHLHNTGEVLEDFYSATTEEQILCGWITPTF